MYNEQQFIEKLILEINSILLREKIDFEIIVIDDFSTDESVSIVEKIALDSLLLVKLESNKGKGNAVRSGIKLASGDLLLIQDADHEYNPNDIPTLYLTAIGNLNSCVYGSRTLGARKYLKGFHSFLFYWPKQSLGAWVFNVLICIYFYALKRIWISDLMTGYKLYNRSLFNNWLPETSGFETDHEITLRILNSGGKIIEVPIRYSPRNKEEGKKIRFTDGVIAFRTIFKFRKTI